MTIDASPNRSRLVTGVLLLATIAAGLALGHGFLWSDMWCYAAGVALAAAVDLGIRSTVRVPTAI